LTEHEESVRDLELVSVEAQQQINERVSALTVVVVEQDNSFVVGVIGIVVQSSEGAILDGVSVDGVVPTAGSRWVDTNVNVLAGSGGWRDDWRTECVRLVADNVEREIAVSTWHDLVGVGLLVNLAVGERELVVRLDTAFRSKGVLVVAKLGNAIVLAKFYGEFVRVEATRHGRRVLVRVQPAVGDVYE